MAQPAACLAKPISAPRAEPRAVRRGQAVFRHAFVPAVLGFFVGAWAFKDACARALQAASIPMDFISVVLLGSIALVWMAEQLYPQNPDWNYRLMSSGARGFLRLGRDLLYLFVIALVSALFIRVTTFEVDAALKGMGFTAPSLLWPHAAPFAVKVGLAFFCVELFSYWLHRAAHHSPFLWRFHSTHHVISELGALKAVRTHPIDNVFFHLVRYTPLLLLGAGREEIVTVTYFGGLLGILAHANVNVAEGILGLVVNLPRYHSVHHSSNIEESRANFGCHTILWDRVFGTFQRAPKGALSVGVEPLGPRTLWQELIAPFRLDGDVS